MGPNDGILFHPKKQKRPWMNRQRRSRRLSCSLHLQKALWMLSGASTEKIGHHLSFSTPCTDYNMWYRWPVKKHIFSSRYIDLSKRNFRCGLVITHSLSIFSTKSIVPFASCMGFFDLVVEDTNVRKRHFFVKKCPQYCIDKAAIRMENSAHYENLSGQLLL